MTIFQILAAIFALMMIYVIWIHGKKKTLSASEVSLWLSLWILFIVIAMFPNLLLGIVTVLHFGRVFDLLTVAALMVLTVLVFASYFTHKELKQQIERLVRELAIRERTSKRKLP